MSFPIKEGAERGNMNPPPTMPKPTTPPPSQRARVTKPQARSEFVVREQTSRALDCAHCPRDSMVITSDGVVTWLSPHGVNEHPHANAITVLALVKLTVARMGVGMLKEIRRIVDERLGKQAA